MANHKAFDDKVRVRDRIIEEKLEVKEKLAKLLDDLNELFESSNSWDKIKPEYTVILNNFLLANSDGHCKKEISAKILQLRQILDNKGENICKLLANDSPMATRHLTSNMRVGIVTHTISGRIDLLSLESGICLLYTSPSPRDQRGSRMPSSA